MLTKGMVQLAVILEDLKRNTDKQAIFTLSWGTESSSQLSRDTTLYYSQASIMK